MPALRYRYTWDQIAALDADHMASWGAFAEDGQTTVDFDDDELPVLAFTMERGPDQFTASYQWIANGKPAGEFVHSRIAVERRPCRFGGSRVYFICPCCRRRVLRLAVLPGGLNCGTCGRVTWATRREQPRDRTLRKVNKIAARLGGSTWLDAAIRPPHMRRKTFDALMQKRAALEERLNADFTARVERLVRMVARSQ